MLSEWSNPHLLIFMTNYGWSHPHCVWMCSREKATCTLTCSTSERSSWWNWDFSYLKYIIFHIQFKSQCSGRMRHQGFAVLSEDSCRISAAWGQGEGLILLFHTHKHTLSQSCCALPFQHYIRRFMSRPWEHGADCCFIMFGHNGRLATGRSV